jgi:hypothetical protein
MRSRRSGIVFGSHRPEVAVEKVVSLGLERHRLDLASKASLVA